MSEKVYMTPGPPQPCRPIEINTETCIGCNLCVEVCLHDVLMPMAGKAQIPIVLYPEECWYCGVCVEECPIEGAITMHHPLKQNLSVRWKRKETGKIFRVGMKNPPPPNTKPPSGDAFKVKRQPS
jgi:NAD-dependent dihydropyrimidine dehydrogenase PreA subunit